MLISEVKARYCTNCRQSARNLNLLAVFRLNKEVYQEVLKILNSQFNEEEFVKPNKNNFGKIIFEDLKLDSKNYIRYKV